MAAALPAWNSSSHSHKPLTTAPPPRQPLLQFLGAALPGRPLMVRWAEVDNGAPSTLLGPKLRCHGAFPIERWGA